MEKPCVTCGEYFHWEVFEVSYLVIGTFNTVSLCPSCAASEEHCLFIEECNVDSPEATMLRLPNNNG